MTLDMNEPWNDVEELLDLMSVGYIGGVRAAARSLSNVEGDLISKESIVNAFYDMANLLELQTAMETTDRIKLFLEETGKMYE